MNFFKKKKPLDCTKCEYYKGSVDNLGGRLTCSPLNPIEESCLLKIIIASIAALHNALCPPPSKESKEFREIQEKAFKLMKRMSELAEKDLDDSDGNAEWKEEKKDIQKEIDDLLNPDKDKK